MMSAEKNKGRAVTSLNYQMLEKSITRKQEAVVLSDAVSYPYDIVERCSILLFDFMQDYILNDNDFSELIHNLTLGGSTVKAKLESIHEQLMLAEQMLSECHHYIDNYKKEDADNDERARAEHKN